MTNFKMVTRAGFLALAVSLAACGGDSGGGGGIIGSPGPTAPVADSFFTAILALISTSPDNTEPVDISAIATTSPDDTEPVAVAL